MTSVLHRISGVLFPAAVHRQLVWVYIAGAIVVGVAALLALMAVPPRYRKMIVVAITFIGGLYFSLEFLLPHHALHVASRVLPGSRGVASFAKGLTDIKPSVADWFMIVGAFTLLLGTSNLFQLHGKAVRKMSPGWYNSLAFFISFFLVLIIGLIKLYTVPRGAAHPTAVNTASTQLFAILFNGFIQNLDAAMFSLVAFYIVSAAYRAFRVKSAEAGLMMATAAIVMLGLVPVGTLITSWLPHSGPLASLRLENATVWILQWPSMAVLRAIEFGLSVGYLAMSLRIWLSLERGSFFDRQL
jgi:hypothetical protein